MEKCVDLPMLITYVVGLGEANELLDGERVVWVAIGMLFKRHLSVLLLNVTGSGVRSNIENSKWIKGLKCLNLRNNGCIDVPDVPKEGSCDDAEVEAALEGLRASFFLFQISLDYFILNQFFEF